MLKQLSQSTFVDSTSVEHFNGLIHYVLSSSSPNLNTARETTDKKKVRE